jgi:hypothetical protein
MQWLTGQNIHLTPRSFFACERGILRSPRIVPGVVKWSHSLAVWTGESTSMLMHDGEHTRAAGIHDGYLYVEEPFIAADEVDG